MRFETMTDDELKRFLLLSTEDLEWAAATVEAAKRWIAYEQQDVDDTSQTSYDIGFKEGYDQGKADGIEEGAVA